MKRTTLYSLRAVMAAVVLIFLGIGDVFSASVVNIAQSPALPIKNMQFGFNVGFLQQVNFEGEALRQISSDGFRRVRFYYPWTAKRKDQVNDVIADIDLLVGLGFDPMFTISGMPKDLPTDEVKKRQWMARLPKQKQQIISKRESFFNASPPESIDQYRGFLDQFIAALEKKYGSEELKKWVFEIGNEPDAPLFFWGDIADFRNIFDASLSAIKTHDMRYYTGGSGFTSRLIAGREGRSDYYGFAREMGNRKDVDFVSFHVYDARFEGFGSIENSVLNFCKDLKNDKIISEWNVDSEKKAAQFINSPEFMEHLINIVYISYKGNVKQLYAHKLMDNPKREEEQLGLFDEHGQPKLAYKYYLMMKRAIENGFIAYEQDGAVIVRNSENVFVAARKGDVQVDMTGYSVVEGSVPAGGNVLNLAAGNWVAARKKQTR